MILHRSYPGFVGTPAPWASKTHRFAYNFHHKVSLLQNNTFGLAKLSQNRVREWDCAFESSPVITEDCIYTRRGVALLYLPSAL